MAQQTQICESCISLDQNEVTRICDKCNSRYCVHYASDIDVRFCNKCMTEITFETKALKARKSQEIIVSGPDMYFAEKSIHDTPDELLQTKIEYYRVILGGLLLEQQERKIKRQSELAKTKLNFVTPVAEDKSKPKKKKVAAVPQSTADKVASITAILTALLKRKPTDVELAAFIMKAGGIK